LSVSTASTPGPARRLAELLARGVEVLRGVDRQHARGAAGLLHRACEARAAPVQAEVADLVVDAQRGVRARPREPLAGLVARQLLRLADVRERARAARDLAARVDRDDRDPGVDGRADRRLELGAGDRDDEAVGPGGDRLLDQLAHRADVVDVRRAVGELDAHLPPRGLDPVAHDRPERRSTPARG
jgi:hypothetical protein